MRRRAKADANQPEIVETLRQLGASVQHLHSVGGGCPDLAIGVAGKTILAEIKVEGEKLNALQVEWHGAWRGAKTVLRSVEDCCELVAAMKGNNV